MVFTRISKKSSLPISKRSWTSAASLKEKANLARTTYRSCERLGLREDLDKHKDIDISLKRMTAHLDPHTTYIDPETIARFRTETTGNFTGIGITINALNPKGFLQVVSPIKGSPAYKAGIKAGDFITEIIREVLNEGHALPKPEVTSTKGMSTPEAANLITGKPGTKVKVRVEREGHAGTMEFEVKRDVVDVETVSQLKRDDKDDWDFYIDYNDKIAYIRLASFARHTARDLAEAMKKLNKSGINGLILDVRENPGGLLTSAVDISDMFVDDGLIVSIRPRLEARIVLHRRARGEQPWRPHGLFGRFEQCVR